VLLLVLLAVGCGSSTAGQTAPSLATVKKAFVAKLNQEALTYRWVACVRNGRHYKGLSIVRCNVNFGMDPHVEAYCTVFEHGKLVTNHENKAIPCGHDNAGFTVPTAEGS
jgi:hypothetical protein